MFRAIIYNTTSTLHTESAKDWNHVGRCFYYLREAIRCHADSTLEWPDDANKNNVQFGRAHQGCRRFDVLDDFVEEKKWVST